MRTLSPLRVLACTALLCSVAACGQPVRSDEKPVQPGELAALLAGGDAPLLLDVRTPGEFAEGHVPGARLVPVQALEARLGELEAYKTRGVVAYCEIGGRSAKAAALLRAHGFANVRVLDGSMQRWRAEKREVATGP